jgi:acetoacetate decarboxylase
MAYKFEQGRIYRMPTHFGPAPGPRQIPEEAKANPALSPRKTLLTASFLTDAAALDRHLPEQFTLSGEPVVTVEFHYMTDIDWLGGRGYTMIHVWWPATFKGARDSVTGSFLAVMWENLADPIITGRDEIGHPKLFAEIPELRYSNGTYSCAASWMGFQFLNLQLSDVVDAEAAPEPPQPSDGTLMLKYVPRTGEWGEADICHVSLTPAGPSGATIERRQIGKGALGFVRAAWKELPTMYHVVNALADLPVLETRGGSFTVMRGGRNYRDQKMLK